MSFLDAALKLADKGFHVFPLAENSKLPLIADFPRRATRDRAQIERWWRDPVLSLEKLYNIGISTTAYDDPTLGRGGLLVVDVDSKKQGADTLFKLELSGKDVPFTRTQTTPTQGQHLIYFVEQPVKQGTDVLGRGLDIRSRGGYIVGAGSELGGKQYSSNNYSLSKAPSWIVDKCGAVLERETQVPMVGINLERAAERATFYLRHEAPLAIKGSGGDQCTFRVAARLKDLGVPAADALLLMLDHWNPRTIPGWAPDRLKTKVENAYLYGKNIQGSDVPERYFDSVGEGNGDTGANGQKAHPFGELNSEFAFVLAGGGHHILWETKDQNGRFRLDHLNEASFHARFASKNLTLGDGKTKPLTTLWMKDASRRSYDGMCFKPEQKCSPQWYNLWKGFAVEPAKEAKHDSLDAFLEHATENVCDGDPKLARWLLGYFAHLVQKPWEKPLTALVFQGAKGVGKNALIDRVGYLLGHHYLLASDKRYLTGNFNGHLENCLLFALDEAFWSGDKAANGNLKSLITGNAHLIEHKGKETYTVDNCTRVCILGNEEWLVPASHDERRFAVFSVGDGRKQDRRFFRDMRIGMEQGGYPHLLRYLLDFDLTGIDVDEAPLTKALLEQKESSMDTFQQWWLLCLQEGRVVGSDFEGEWPNEKVSKDRFRDTYYRYCTERGIRERKIDSRTIGKFLSRYAPGIDICRKRQGTGEAVHMYQLPDLETCRAGWEHFIGHQVQWN